MSWCHSIIEKRGSLKMNAKERALRALQRMAAQQGTTVEMLCSEMQQAIDAAYDAPINRAAWEMIPLSGNRPTPEDLIAYAVDLLKNHA